MLARFLAASPSRPFGKDSILLRRRKHGTTDRLALPHQSNWNVRLVRPSVQLPAGIHGWRGYKDSEGVCKTLDAPDSRQICLDLVVCMTYN